MATIDTASIKEQQSTTFTTKRAISPGLEGILYEPLPVLDHGFVRVIDYMGNDAAVVQAARVSYGTGTKKTREDQGLINYLLRHRHSTPFEMCEIKLHVKLPLFVARQWIRHRTANVNEYSARYSIMDNEFYIPSPENLAVQATSNRQGRGATLSATEAESVMALLKEDAERAYEHYTHLINTDDAGAPQDPTRPSLARELARMNLSLNYYTQWYWKIDLFNYMNFISLRADGHAQYEIRVYAEVMRDILQLWCPHAYEAFKKYRLEGTHLSKGGIDILKTLLHGADLMAIDPATYGLSPREWEEFKASLGL